MEINIPIEINVFRQVFVFSGQSY